MEVPCVINDWVLLDPGYLALFAKPFEKGVKPKFLEGFFLKPLKSHFEGWVFIWKFVMVIFTVVHFGFLGYLTLKMVGVQNYE